MSIDAKLDVIGLVVADMAVSLTFYTAYAELTDAGYQGEHGPMGRLLGTALRGAA